MFAWDNEDASVQPSSVARRRQLRRPRSPPPLPRPLQLSRARLRARPRLRTLQRPRTPAAAEKRHTLPTPSFVPCQAWPGQSDTLITESPNRRIAEERILPNRRIAKRLTSITT